MSYSFSANGTKEAATAAVEAQTMDASAAQVERDGHAKVKQAIKDLIAASPDDHEITASAYGSASGSWENGAFVSTTAVTHTINFTSKQRTAG